MMHMTEQTADNAAPAPTWRCLDCGTAFYDSYAPERGDLDSLCPPECPRCGEEKRLEWIGLSDAE